MVENQDNLFSKDDVGLASTNDPRIDDGVEIISEDNEESSFINILFSAMEGVVVLERVGVLVTVGVGLGVEIFVGVGVLVGGKDVGVGVLVTVGEGVSVIVGATVSERAGVSVGADVGAIR